MKRHQLLHSFVNVLKVNMATHKGYTGGLDPGGTTGKESPYVGTNSMDIMFHEVVRMPTVHEDPQQLLKVR